VYKTEIYNAEETLQGGPKMHPFCLRADKVIAVKRYTCGSPCTQRAVQ